MVSWQMDSPLETLTACESQKGYLKAVLVAMSRFALPLELVWQLANRRSRKHPWALRNPAVASASRSPAGTSCWPVQWLVPYLQPRDVWFFPRVPQHSYVFSHDNAAGCCEHMPTHRPGVCTIRISFLFTVDFQEDYLWFFAFPKWLHLACVIHTLGG